MKYRFKSGRGKKVITLCGSTRFKDEFMETQKRLTLEGNIVISVGLFGHAGDDEVWTEGTKENLPLPLQPAGAQGQHRPLTASTSISLSHRCLL